MTAVAPAPADPAGPSTSDGIEDRGRLDIHESVLRKVAEHSADQVPGTARTAKTVAGVGVGDRGATARIAVRADRVDVRLDVALHYPGAVRDTVANLRERVGAELNRVTGYRLGSMDVTVSALVSESRDRVL